MARLTKSDLDKAYHDGYMKANETAYQRGLKHGYRQGFADAKHNKLPRFQPLPPHPCELEGRPWRDGRTFLVD